MTWAKNVIIFPNLNSISQELFSMLKVQSDSQ